MLNNLTIPGIGVIGAATLLAASLLTTPSSFAAKYDKNHRDAFMRGDADEEDLARSVRHELLMLPYYGVFDDLAFRMEGNNVILLGEVTRPTLKSDAEAAIKRIPGIGTVGNQIEVLPLSAMDDTIRMATYRAIYGNPTLSTRYGYRSLPPIHIIVKNGNITLRGVVANEMDKNLAYLRANAIPGVFSVTNKIPIPAV